MKTYIVQLEEHDDAISARDKMGWAKGERVLLVFPERGASRSLGRRLDLVLIQRRADALGSQLALVTRDGDVRYNALKLGIPVFKTLKQAQNAAHWRLPRGYRNPSKAGQASIFSPQPGEVGSDPAADGEQLSELPRRVLPQRPEPTERPLSAGQRALFFALGVLAVLALAAVLLPRATIRLEPQTRVQEVLLDAWTGPEVSSGGALEGAFPGRWKTVIVEGRSSRPTSGSVRLPDRFASGEVEFTSQIDAPVTIPKGMVVRTAGENPQRFTVTRSGTLPPGPGTQISLPVQALAPGAAGNLPAGKLTAVEGAIGSQATASNPRPTGGGADRQEPAPTVEDRRLLEEALPLDLARTAIAELQADLQPGDLLVPASLELVRTLEQDFLPAENASLPLPADQLRLHQRLEFRALWVSAEDQQRLAQRVFDANLPAGFAPLDGTLRWESLGEARPAEDGTFRWSMAASRRLAADTSEAEAARIALGASPAAAIRRLQAQLPLEQAPVIAMQPAWWPVLPILPFQITVIEAAQTEPQTSVPVSGAAP